MYLKSALISILFFAFLNYVITLDCYQCQSDATPECATKPGKQIDVTECADNDTCVVAIFDGATHRGCFSSIIKNGNCPAKTCRSCDIPNCNGGVFPENRRKCYQCSGKECMDVSGEKFKPLACPYYLEEDRCYTNIYDLNKHYIARGCVSKTKENCDNISLKCNYDGCNNEPGSYNTTCQLCDYRHGPWTSPRNYPCKRTQVYDQDEGTDKCGVRNDTATCSQRVLYGHKEKCFIHWDEKDNSVKRGCSSEKGFFPTAKFSECYGDNCNSDCIDMKCNICNSDDDPSCKNNTSSLREQNCADGTFSCYSCEDNYGTLERGCGFQKSSIDRKCYHCYDDNGCNRNLTRSCYKCTSTQDPNCSEWKDIKNIEHELCQHYDENCVTTKTEKYMVRGCESTTVECTLGDPDCQRCSGSLCNSGFFKMP